jgi:hypothetical protein
MLQIVFKADLYNWFHRIFRRPGLGGDKTGENQPFCKKNRYILKKGGID